MEKQENQKKKKIKTLSSRHLERIETIFSKRGKNISVNEIFNILKNENLIGYSYPTFLKRFRYHFPKHKTQEQLDKPIDLNLKNSNQPTKPSNDISLQNRNAELDNIKEDISILIKRSETLQSKINEINDTLRKIHKQSSSNDIITLAKEFLEYINSKNTP